MEGDDQFDRAPLAQSEQERRASSLPAPPMLWVHLLRQCKIADATLISATAHTPVAQRFPKTAARAKANLQPHCPTAAGESSKFTKAANNRFTNKPQRRPSGREAASQAESGRRCLFHPGSGL